MAESIVESSTETVLNAAKTGTIKVLHVDDDQAFLKVAKQCLDTQGKFEVDTASSVDEALEKLKKTDYDAVVSDYQMPGKDGLEFLKELREKGNIVPFIVFTGKGREQVAITALNLGADQYIDKHGDPETVYYELAHALSQAVDRRSAQIESLKREAKLNAILESSPEAITITDLNGNIVECNQATVVLHGFESKEELIGKNSLELIAKKDREKAIQNLKKTLESGSVKAVEYTCLTMDGLEFPTELSASVVRDPSGKPEHFVAITKDITERKKAEEEMRNNALILENIADSVIVTDLEGRITFWNEGASKIFGFSAEEILGENIAKVSKPKEREQVAPAQLEQVRKGVLFLGEWEGVRKDGEPVWLMLTTKILKNSQGETVGMIGVGKDITEREKMEQQLRIKEAAVASSINGVAFADLEGKLTYVNSSFLEMWGYANENEVLGRPAEDFWSSKENAVEVVKALEHKGGWVGDLMAKKKDGSTFEVQLSGSMVKDKTGKPSCMMGSFLDITERRKAGQALQESEEKYRKLVELAPDGMVAVNVEGIVTSANRSFLTLVGYDSEQGIVGKPFTELMTMRREDIPRFQGMFMSLMKGESPSPVEFLYVRRDGTSRWAEVHPGLLIKDGKPAGLQAIMRDATERKNAEKHLNEMNKKLEITNEKLHVVGGLTRHDVRNKLSAVTGNAYLLKQKLVGDAKALEQLNDMETAVRLVEKIFEFARIYEKLGTEQLVSMDVGEAVDGAVSLFSGLKGVKVVNECDGLTVLADSLLRQLFYNLVDNSLKYGEKLSRIRVFYEEKNDLLNVLYEDDGVGVPQAAKPKLFDEGYTTGKGSGYGLYLVKKMMEVYGWTISETGTHGKGAQFTITIPRIGSTGKGNYQVQKTQQRQQESATNMEVPNAHSQPHS